MGRPAQLALPPFLAREQRGPGWGAWRNHRPSASCWGGRWAAVGCFLWPLQLKGTNFSPSLCRPASHLYGQLVEENKYSRTSGYHFIQVSFPGNQNLVSLKTKVHLIPLRVLWLAVSVFEELTLKSQSLLP